MGKLSRKLRIGEKIGVGFGVVGLLFLGVIWHYHSTLQEALGDYRQLHDVYGLRKAQALAIENSILRVQRSEKHFILTRNESLAEQAITDLQDALETTAALQPLDDDNTSASARLTELIHDYEQHFRSVVAAWRTMGLDHDSGLQGAFRDSAHELEAMAGQFDVDRLYLLLLQIRRSEKDLGLRREALYRDRVSQLIQDFATQISLSELDAGLQGRLFHEIEVYRETFEQYAAQVLSDPQSHGGKGPFRQAAHRIEQLLKAHYISGMGANVLQVRRREKDYLLRQDKQYVDMTLDELDRIVAQVETTGVSQRDKQRSTVLLANYRRDFLALVEQNDRIAGLNRQMNAAVAEILKRVDDDIANTDQTMNAMRSSIDKSAEVDEQAMLWVVIGATVLGVFLAFAITLPIARPLRKMAGLLDRLASEEPAERMHFYAGGRDEVNAMAGSVNDIADHKAGFIAWWEASMREAEACARVEQLITQPGGGDERRNADQELRLAVLARKELLWEQYTKMHHLIERIIDRTEALLAHARPGSSEIALNTIRYSARSVQTILEMASTPEIWKRAG